MADPVAVPLRVVPDAGEGPEDREDALVDEAVAVRRGLVVFGPAEPARNGGRVQG